MTIPHGDLPAVDTGFSHREPAPASSSRGYTNLRPRRVEDQLDAGARRLTELERDHNTLQRQYGEQQQRLTRLEQRLDAFMAAQTRERTDLASNAHGAHHVIAQDYQAYVEQRVQNLARAAAKTPTQTPEGFPPALWLIGQLCRVLFGSAAPELSMVLEALGLRRLDSLAPQATRVCEAAHQLRRRAEATGLPYQWDFEHVAGQRLDEEWQEPWPSCDANQPGQFVISPAYIVAERVFSLQRLYTGPSLLC